MWQVKTNAEAIAFKDVPLAFYRKRFIRLWPAAALWLLINFIMEFALDGLYSYPLPIAAFKKLMSGLVYLYNFQEATNVSCLGYLWSLSVEWQFYMIMPLILLLVRRDDLRVVVFVGILIAGTTLHPGGAQWWLFRFNGIIICYILRHRLGVTVPNYTALENRFLVSLVNIILLIATVMTPRFHSNPAIGCLMSSIFGGILVFLASADRGYISTFGIKPIIKWLGSRSYSIYLSHIQAIYMVLFISNYINRENVQFIFVPVLFLSLTIIFAEATFRLFEAPSHKKSQAVKLIEV